MAVQKQLNSNFFNNNFEVKFTNIFRMFKIG